MYFLYATIKWWQLLTTHVGHFDAILWSLLPAVHITVKNIRWYIVFVLCTIFRLQHNVHTCKGELTYTVQHLYQAYAASYNENCHKSCVYAIKRDTVIF
jgi:hypothetical protein